MPTSQPTNTPTQITPPQLVELQFPGNSIEYTGNDTYAYNRTSLKTRTTYWCHRKHFSSSPNVHQQIFGGVELSSTTDYIKSAKIWVKNWNAATDSLTLSPSDDTNINYARDNFLDVNITDRGIMRLDMKTQVSGSPLYRSPLGERIWQRFGVVTSEVGQDLTWLPHVLWVNILRMASYKFIPTEESPIRCTDILGRSKTFGIQVTDRRNRVSRVYYHSMVFRSAAFIFTDAAKVLTSNQGTGEMLLTPERGVYGGPYGNTFPNVTAFYL